MLAAVAWASLRPFAFLGHGAALVITMILPPPPPRFKFVPVATAVFVWGRFGRGGLQITRKRCFRRDGPPPGRRPRAGGSAVGVVGELLLLGGGIERRLLVVLDQLDQRGAGENIHRREDSRTVREDDSDARLGSAEATCHCSEQQGRDEACCGLPS